MRGCACRGTAGLAHVSCLAEQAKILVAEAEDHNLFGTPKFDEKWERWRGCGLCEQRYHGVVHCALGWACWKTYVGRPEGDWTRCSAMTEVGNGLSDAGRHEEALSVRVADLSMRQRLGASENYILVAQSNLANAYQALGRNKEVLRLRRDVYSGYVRLRGAEHRNTLLVAENYAMDLLRANRFEEAKSLMRKTISAARRVFGKDASATQKMRSVYAGALYSDPTATLDDCHEAVTMLEEAARTSRRMLGAAHPIVVQIGNTLQEARAALHARETQSSR